MTTPNSDSAALAPNVFRCLWQEAVRANPLYVISAALLAYAVAQLMTEIDPQIGKLGDVSVILAILHVYEIAVLCVATVVLKKRVGAGLDMHGLLIVAALYLGVTFIALDELIAVRPWLGALLVPVALGLAALKLKWYAGLPGVYLPAKYRHAALAILGAHALAPVLNSRDLFPDMNPHVMQGIAWLLGWLSYLLVLRLICTESGSGAGDWDPAEPRIVSAPGDPLATRACGALAVCIAAATSLTHILISDWIADHSFDIARLYPGAAMLAAAIVLLRWRCHRVFGVFEALLTALPFWMLQVLWRKVADDDNPWRAEMLAAPAAQICAASIAFYIALARGTGNRNFYAGLFGPAAAPATTLAWRSQGSIPHFRALATAFMGFATLGLGMLISLYREKLLGKAKE